MIVRWITNIGAYAIATISLLGTYALFVIMALSLRNSVKGKISLLLTQIYILGAKSMVLIIVVAFFTGLVLGLQTYYTLIQFGSESLLGVAVALTLIRELAPVLTALMLVARVGSAITAELSVMRLSGQIDALSVMNINPLHYLVQPKILALSFSTPLLNAIFILTGIFSAYLIGVELLGISSGSYFDSIMRSITTKDLVGSFIKAFVFGLLISSIASFIGYSVRNKKDSMGPLAVSNATTQSVVYSSVIILIADYIITSFLL